MAPLSRCRLRLPRPTPNAPIWTPTTRTLTHKYSAIGPSRAVGPSDKNDSMTPVESVGDLFEANLPAIGYGCNT